MQGEIVLVKAVMENMKREGGGWWRRTRKYLEWAGIEEEEDEWTGSEEKGGRERERVEREWREEVNEKKYSVVVQGV